MTFTLENMPREKRQLPCQAADQECPLVERRPALPATGEDQQAPCPAESLATTACEVETLLAITAMLNASNSEAEMVQAVADHARQLCDADVAAVALLSGGGVTVYHRRATGGWTEHRGQVSDAGSITGHVLATQQPYRSDDLSLDPYTDRDLDIRFGLFNQLTVPLGSAGRATLGVLTLYNKRGNKTFTAYDQMLLEAVAVQTSLAIERARAFDQATAGVEALRRSEARWRALVANISDTVFILDRDGVVRWVGPGYERLRGAPPDAVLGKHAWDGIIAEDLPAAHAFFAGVLQAVDGQPHSIELRKRADIGYRYFHVTATNLLHEPAIEGIVTNVLEITEHKRVEQELRASEARFRALVQNSSDLTLVYDHEGSILYASPSSTRLLGYAPEELQGTNVLTWLHPDDQPAGRRSLRSRLVAPSPPTRPATARLRHRERGWRWVESYTVNLLHDPHVGGIVANIRDITEQKELEDRLTRQAFTDGLTNLPNRPLFVDRLGHAVARADHTNRTVAVYLVDLDNFHAVNDSRGNQFGDQVLAAVARRFAECLRPGDTLARFGSDEFAVLIDELESAEAVATMAECLLDALRQPLHIGERELTIGASVGIATRAGRHTDPTDLLRQADISLNLAKSGGGSRWVQFDPRIHAQNVEQLDLAAELPGVAERGELQLYFQPEVDLDSGRILGAEALVRWQHPERGMLGPATFIPIAEQSDTILDIGLWVLREACRSARSWPAASSDQPPPVVSVNLAARQLQQPDLVERVAEVLDESGLPPSSLCLEVTESAAIQDIDAAIRTLSGLRALGVTIAIDDFGTGYSSLSYLRRLPADFLKIDRSFLTELASDAQAVAIVRAMAALAHEMGMRVIAEGIETKEQLTSAIVLMCDFGQGYYFSRPVPEEVWEQMLRSERRHPWLAG